MFQRGETADAARYINWATRKGNDLYFTPASFTLAVANGTDGFGPKFRGERQGHNAQSVRAFWLDLDVKRDGDGKDPARVFGDRLAAVTWLNDFCSDVGLPLPNLWVNSGYGFHVYWVLETSLPTDEWQSYAEALKALVLGKQAPVDIAVIADRVRILRLPGTLNFKDRANPATVHVIDTRTRGDFPNEDILSKLRPHIPASFSRPLGKAAGTGSVSRLNAAGQANMPAPSSQQYLFAEVAQACPQVARSLAEGGEHDDRQFWYLGHISLASYCADGADFVHKIGEKHSGYSAADTDAEFARALGERQSKDPGPPLCTSYDAFRPGVCQACPFWGKIKTPAVAVPVSDLPPRYRRANGCIERRTIDGYVLAFEGDVRDPVLTETPGSYALSFLYTYGPRTHAIRMTQADIKLDPSPAYAQWAGQKMQVTHLTAREVSNFVVSWIGKLRAANQIRTGNVYPFGWAEDAAKNKVGFAVGGTLYDADGTTAIVAGGDPNTNSIYQPLGNLAKWKDTCEFAIKIGIDAHVMIACAFGAPLMELMGHKGLLVHFWSRESALGKSGSMLVAQTAFGGRAGMFGRQGTAFSKMHKMGAVRSLVVLVDELQLDKDNAKQTVDWAYDIVQGVGRDRLTSAATLKPAEEWSTIVVTAGNMPIMDHIIAHRGFTDAGAARALQFFIDRPQLPLDPAAQLRINECEKGAGDAGAIYAAWIAAHLSEVEEIRDKWNAIIAKETDPQGPERFQVAGMCCILSGATISNMLGLTKFDVRAMWNWMRTQFFAMRQERKSVLPLVSGQFPVVSEFDRFMSDTSQNRAITSEFRHAGVPPKGFMVVQEPAAGRHCYVHIGQAEAVARVDRQHLRKWCQQHNIPGEGMLEEMTRAFGAKAGTKRILGAGLQCAGGQVDTIEVPLRGTLAPYITGGLDILTTPSAAVGTTAQTPGNKPKVK